MRKTTTKHHIEILPASLLPHREQWQGVTHNLPTGSWLLVLPEANSRLYAIGLKVAQALRDQGKTVIVWQLVE